MDKLKEFKRRYFEELKEKHDSNKLYKHVNQEFLNGKFELGDTIEKVIYITSEAMLGLTETIFESVMDEMVKDDDRLTGHLGVKSDLTIVYSDGKMGYHSKAASNKITEHLEKLKKDLTLLGVENIKINESEREVDKNNLVWYNGDVFLEFDRGDYSFWFKAVGDIRIEVSEEDGMTSEWIVDKNDYGINPESFKNDTEMNDLIERELLEFHNNNWIELFCEPKDDSNYPDRIEIGDPTWGHILEVEAKETIEWLDDIIENL